MWNLSFNARAKNLEISTGDKSGTDWHSDPTLDGYIVLCRTCSHCTDSDSDPFSLFLYRTGIRVRVRIRVRLRQCKWAITTGTSLLQIKVFGPRQTAMGGLASRTTMRCYITISFPRQLKWHIHLIFTHPYDSLGTSTSSKHAEYPCSTTHIQYNFAFK